MFALGRLTKLGSSTLGMIIIGSILLMLLQVYLAKRTPDSTNFAIISVGLFAIAILFGKLLK